MNDIIPAFLSILLISVVFVLVLLTIADQNYRKGLLDYQRYNQCVLDKEASIRVCDDLYIHR